MLKARLRSAATGARTKAHVATCHSTSPPRREAGGYLIVAGRSPAQYSRLGRHRESVISGLTGRLAARAAIASIFCRFK